MQILLFKFSWIVVLVVLIRSPTKKIVEKTLADVHKITNFMKVFSFERFPLREREREGGSEGEGEGGTVSIEPASLSSDTSYRLNQFSLCECSLQTFPVLTTKCCFHIV